MKQRKFSIFFAASLALAFVGCSHDELPGGSLGNEDNGSKDAVYMNVTVQLPVGPGTRSVTEDKGGSSDGTEFGQENENKVHSILLVLADKDNKFIGCGEKLESLSSNNGKVTTVQSISKSVLSAYYGEDGVLDTEKKEDEIHVFVFCNPTSALRDIFKNMTVGDETWYEQACTITENPKGISDNAAIWGGPDHQGGFLMSSFEISKKQFPENFEDWNKYTSVSTPFLLSGTNPSSDGNTDNDIKNDGAIKVERSVARFDFKDGSTLKDNTYNVVKDPEDDTKYIMQIQLQKMALFNMSKSFYYLRRVSGDGLNDNSILCGTETSANYVVDTDAAEKSAGSIIAGNTYSDHFNFCLGRISEDGEWGIDGEARNQWYTSKISDVLDGTEDNPDWEGAETHGDYRIWRYVTENTIPGDPKMQVNGVSTGIVFKGQMKASGDDKESSLYKALTEAEGNPATDPILYVFGNEIFVRWTEVRAMAIERAPGSDLYKAVFGDATNIPVAEKIGDDGTITVSAVYSDDEDSADYKWNVWYNENKDDDAKQKTFKDAAVGQGFTLYQSSIDNDVPGYYCYYFYLNRHNDNGNPGVMDKMEFAVVRNNVYKLAVTNISRLGHPRITDNDPDPIEPENPDEDGDVYLSVDVQVLPWTVRVNNIEF